MMSDVRLINANALKEKLQADHDFYINAWGGFKNLPANDKARVDELTASIAAVVNAPTIDAVPVVRCRECEKFWEYTESHKATVEKADGDCMIRCMVAPDDPQFCAVQKDDYCSMGKRNGAKMDAKEEAHG